MDGNEWEDSSSCILKAAVEGALIHLMQPGNSTESALQTQFPRITVAIDKLSGENMLNERPFYMSLIQALLRHKSKLSHGMRDMVVNKWLSWFKSKSGGSCMTSSVHECFLILLDEVRFDNSNYIPTLPQYLVNTRLFNIDACILFTSLVLNTFVVVFTWEHTLASGNMFNFC